MPPQSVAVPVTVRCAGLELNMAKVIRSWNHVTVVDTKLRTVIDSDCTQTADGPVLTDGRLLEISPVADRPCGCL